MRRIKDIAATAAILTGFVLSTAAFAESNSKIFNVYPDASADGVFTSGESWLFGGGARLDRLNGQTARTAAQNYFDFDTIVTLGSLVVASGAFVAVAAAASRRKRAEEADEAAPQLPPSWRDALLQNLEADLTTYARGWRRAA